MERYQIALYLFVAAVFLLILVKCLDVWSEKQAAKDRKEMALLEDNLRKYNQERNERAIEGKIFIRKQISRLDGMAAVNLEEPTFADLERIYLQYLDAKEEISRMERKIEELGGIVKDEEPRSN